MTDIRIPGLAVIDAVDTINDYGIIYDASADQTKRIPISALAIGSTYNYTASASTVTLATNVEQAGTVTDADNVENADVVTSATNVNQAASVTNATNVNTYNVSWAAATSLFVDVDASESDQGVTGGGNTIYALASGAGTSKSVTLALRHTGAGNTTDYTLDTSIDLTTYPLVYLYIEPGARLIRTTGNETITIYSPENLIVSAKQQITAVDMLRFAEPGSVPVEWWGAKGDNSTDCYAGTQYAVNSLSTSGGRILLFGAEYLYHLQPGPDNPTIELYDDQTVEMGLFTRLYSRGTGSGVNSYAAALFVNEDQVGGNTNIALTGGIFKSAGSSYDGGTFFAFKNVNGLRIQNVTALDVNASCRGQLSHCTNFLIDNYYTRYEETWFTGGAPSFEDALRLGSGCNNGVVQNCVLNSGDDAIALNNEPAENGNSTTGADIHDITISNVVATTILGHALRIYQQSTMTTGDIYDIRIDNLIGSDLSGEDGLSIANYATGPVIKDITISGYTGKQTTSTGAGILVLKASNVKLINTKISGWHTYGYSISNSPYTEIINPHSDDEDPASPVDVVVIASGSHHSVVSGGKLHGGRNSVQIYDDDCLVIGAELISPAASGINIIDSALRTRIIGNSIKGVAGSNWGIYEQSGDYTLAIGNDLSGNSNAYNASTPGTHSQYIRNIGAVLGFYDITVGASPYTYTAGPAPETVYINGGTVSSVASGAHTLFGGTDKTVSLMPFQALTVTYSSAPAMKKYVE